MDWQNMFRRYADFVGDYEGIDFLYERDWTPEEWKAIRALWDDVN